MIKILIVANYNKGRFSPFIEDQAAALKHSGVSVAFFRVEGKGALGYLKNRKKLLAAIRREKPDLIHAHYGLSGLLANLQRQKPVVTTYHGSDINYKNIFRLSKIAMWLSEFSIFVSQKNLEKSKQKTKCDLIPCGVDFEVFAPVEKTLARQEMGLDLTKKYVLFSSSFENAVKNPVLARRAVELLPDVTLLELSGYTRENVAMLMNAVDAVLMTSFSEGSPQFIKEAMACNCPIISVDVGDVREVTKNVNNCFIVDYNENEIADKIKEIFAKNERTNGREKINHLDNKLIAKRLIEVYDSIVKK